RGLIVTNGYELKIQIDGPIDAAVGGTRIIAFRERDKAPAGRAGAAGQKFFYAEAGQPGRNGGVGARGETGAPGRSAGLIVIQAESLSNALPIEYAGHARRRR